MKIIKESILENYTSPPPGGRKSITTWLGTTMLGALIAFGGGTAHAAAPPAGTNIGNQALATFIDGANIRQETKSNNVLTIVSQVGSLTLTNDNTKVAAVGNIVYMPHVLTNTGNATDTFTLKAADGGSNSPSMTAISIYPDPNGTGIGNGTALCSASSCANGVQVSVAGGSAYNFVVAYLVPGSAVSPWVGKGTVSATGGKTDVYDPAKITVTNTDTINLTNGAAFAVTKTLTAPSVKAPNNLDWPPALNTASPSLASCSTTWPVTSGNGCNYTVFTINYANNGAAAGSFAFKDAIPPGMTYVTKSTVWSGNGGVAVAEPSTGPSVNFTVSGNNLSVSVPNVAPNASGTVSFVVLVNSKATPDGANTGNVVLFGTGDCLFSNIDSCATTPTNKPPFTTKQKFAPVLATVSGFTTPDGTSPLPLPSTKGDDLDVQPSAAQNGSVRFQKNYVTNAGNGVDTFNITVLGTASPANFPAATQFNFYKADGLTPLLDTNNDGIVDTGPLAPGESVLVVMKVVMPRDVAVGSGPYSARVDATSVGSDGTAGGKVVDSVWNQISTTTSMALVDLTNTAAGSSDPVSGDLGAGPSTQPTTTATTTPGKAASFNLFIKNNDTVANKFNLAASQAQSFPGNVPSGWTVKFYASGASCDASTPPAELSQPIDVAAGAQTQVLACVTAPAAPVTADVIQNIFFQVKAVAATASDGSIVADIKFDAVKLTPANKAQLLLTSDQDGQVSPGGSVTYLHTLQNASTGNKGLTCGALSVVPTSPNSGAGWSYSISVVNADNSETTLSGSLPALKQGDTVKLRLKVTAPMNAIDKFIDNVTLTVTDTAASNCGTVNNRDATTVVGSQMILVKELAVDAACNGTPGLFTVQNIDAKPGSCVIYRITATNNGATPVTKVWINDMVPSYTTYTTKQPSSQCVATNATAGSAAFVHTAGSVGVSCGGNDLVLQGSGTGSLTMQFGVQLNAN